jgi:hypothetical protein
MWGTFLGAASPYLLWIKLAGLALMVASTSYLTHRIDVDHYEGIIAKANLERQQAVTTALEQQAAEVAARNKTIRDAGERHAQDQIAINSLTADVGRLQRIHIPTGRPPACRDDATGKNSDRETRLFSDKVDKYFADFQAETGRLIQRCDQLNIDAIQMNNSIQQIK